MPARITHALFIVCVLLAVTPVAVLACHPFENADDYVLAQEDTQTEGDSDEGDSKVDVDEGDVPGDGRDEEDVPVDGPDRSDTHRDTHGPDVRDTCSTGQPVPPTDGMMIAPPNCTDDVDVSVDTNNDVGAGCVPPQVDCGDGTCIDLASDPTNCGACGMLCPAGRQCSNGTCCPAGAIACDPNGECINLDYDRAHCGGCFLPCDPASTCVQGTCLPCDGMICDGACTDPQFDTANCGSCGNACLPGELCVFGSCDQGLTCVTDGDCGMLGLPPTWKCCAGSCEDTESSEEHCGECEMGCATPQICQGGLCGIQ